MPDGVVPTGGAAGEALCPAERMVQNYREKRGVMDQIFPRWNPLTSWMLQIEGFQRAA
jgi:hypothetical protein